MDSLDDTCMLLTSRDLVHLYADSHVTRGCPVTGIKFDKTQELIYS